MIFFLSLVLHQKNPFLQLTPPMHLTNVSEIGNWTLVGTATLTKTAVRLTTPVEDNYGAICSRVPVTFSDWEAEFELSSFGGNGGYQIQVLFTDELCPFSTLYAVTGFSLIINVSDADSEGKVPIFLTSRSKEITENEFDETMYQKPVAYIKYRDPKSKRPIKTTFKLVLIGKTLTVKCSQSISFNHLFTKELSYVPREGYFMITAFTTSQYDNNDVNSFSIKPISTVRPLTKDYSTINRKNIEHLIDVHHSNKKRRLLAMETVQKYLKNNTQEFNLEDSMKIIKEAENRAKQGITFNELNSYLLSHIPTLVEKALDNIKTSGEILDSASINLDVMWNNLRAELIQISQETGTYMANVHNEVMELAKNLKLKGNENFGKISNDILVAQNSSVSIVPYILGMICVCEFCAYIVWFCYKVQRTRYFKKIG